MITKYRILGGVSFVLSLIGIVSYFNYSEIRTIEDIRMGWGLLVGLILSIMVLLNWNGIIQKQVAKDKKMVTGFERFTVLQMRLILASVVLFVFGIGIWVYFVFK
jgi:hypothetical protein